MILLWLLVFVGGIVVGIADIVDRIQRANRKAKGLPPKVYLNPGTKRCPYCGQIFQVGFWPGDYSWETIEPAYNTHVMLHLQSQ